MSVILIFKTYDLLPKVLNKPGKKLLLSIAGVQGEKLALEPIRVVNPDLVLDLVRSITITKMIRSVELSPSYIAYLCPHYELYHRSRSTGRDRTQ